MADAQFSGSLISGKLSRSDALHHRGESLLKLGAFIHRGPADALALLPRPLHPGHHQVPVDLLPCGVLIPDGLASQGS